MIESSFCGYTIIIFWKLLFKEKFSTDIILEVSKKYAYVTRERVYLHLNFSFKRNYLDKKNFQFDKVYQWKLVLTWP